MQSLRKSYLINHISHWEYAQNHFQIVSINLRMTSKKLQFWLKIVANNYLFTATTNIKRKLGLIFEKVKKFARWRHKSKISKRTVRSIISPLIFCLRRCLGYQNNQYGPFCGFGLLFSNFLIDFEDFCRGFLNVRPFFEIRLAF